MRKILFISYIVIGSALILTDLIFFAIYSQKTLYASNFLSIFFVYWCAAKLFASEADMKHLPSDRFLAYLFTGCGVLWTILIGILFYLYNSLSWGEAIFTLNNLIAGNLLFYLIQKNKTESTKTQ